MNDNSLTIQQAAKKLGVSPTTLRRWEEKGILVPFRTAGNQRRYAESQIADFKNNPLGISAETATEDHAESPSFEATSPMPAPAFNPIPEPEVTEPARVAAPATETPGVFAGYPMPVMRPNSKMLVPVTSAVLGLFILLIGFIFAANLANSIRPGLDKFGHPSIPTYRSNSKLTKAQVLAANDATPAYILKVNIPGIFGKSVTFLDDVVMRKQLTVAGVSNLNGGIKTNNADINAGKGKLTASNIVYSILAGTNVTITGDPQHPTVNAGAGANAVSSVQGATGAVVLTGGDGVDVTGLTISNTGVLSVQGEKGDVTFAGGSGIGIDGTTITNSDPGSAQKIFGNVFVGGTTLSAGSNTDTLTFAAGSGVTLTPNSGTNTITIDATGSSSQWLTSGSNIYYNLGNVGIGTTTPAAALDVAGSAQISGSVTFSGTTNGILHADNSGLLSASAVALGTSDVSGILGVGNGGTGVNSPPANGQILIGNGSGYALATITGTSNQINVTNGAGTITLSLPQNIDTTANPSFNSLNLTSNTNQITLGSGTTGLITMASLTGARTYTFPDASGEICLTSGNCSGSGGALTGSGTPGYVPKFTSITGIGDSSIFDNGKVGIGTNSPEGLFSVVGGPAGQALVSLNYTGSGQNILVGSASGATKFAFDASGNLNLIGGGYQIGGVSVLSSNTLGAGVTTSSLTTVSALNAGSITSGFGAIDVGTDAISGGDITASGTTGFTGSGNGAGLTFSGSGNHIVSASGGVLEFGAATLTGAITGNGKDITGLNNLAANGAVTFGSFTSNGGILYANGSGVVAQATAGSANQVLHGGTTPSFGLVALGSDVSGTLPVTSGGTGLGSFVTGDLVYASGANTLAARAIGTAGQLLTVVGGVPTWQDAGGTVNFWQRSNGVVSPLNVTDDFIVGGTATASGKFQVSGTNGNISASGTISGLTGITSSGTILFSGLSSGVVHSSSGTLSTSAVTNAELQNSSVTINTGTGLSGGGSVSLGGTLNLANTGVTSITGTSDQVIASVSTGAVTLSLPQSINTTSSPTFNGLTVSSLTRGSDTITDFTGTGLQLVGGALETTLGTSVDLTTEVTGTLPITNGGTNTNTLGSAGSIAYSNGSAYAFTAVGTGGQVLTSNGSGAPTWTDSSSLGTNYWQRIAGAVSPLNITDDLLIGATSTGSAKFRVSGTNGDIVGTGTLTGLTGLTSSGTILFSGLSSGVVHSSSGTLSVSAVTNAELQNSSVTINTGTGLSGGGSVSLGGTLNLANTGVTALAGTLNQIAVSNGGVGSVTLSLPQDINTTSSPTFNGLTVSSLTRGSDTITDFTGTGLQMNGGSLETTLGTSVDLTSEVTGILPIANGGTNTNTLGAAGSVAYSNGSAYAFTGVGTGGQVLTSNGSGAPTWADLPPAGTNYWQRIAGAVSPLNISDDLLIGATSTGSAKFRVSGTNGNIVGTGTLTGLTGLTSSGTILFSGLSSGVVHSSSGTLSVSAVTNAELQNSSVTINTGTGLSGGGSVSLGGTLNLANTGVTALAGTLNQIAVSNGGVGSVTLSLPQDINTTSSPTFNGLTVSSFTRGSDTITDFTGTGLQMNSGSLETTLGTSVDLTSEVTGMLPIANGGTNANSIGSAGSIAYSNGSAYSFTGVGTSGQILTSNGSGAPTWADLPPAGTNYWQRIAGAVSPLNISDDLLIGDTSTGSAKFRVSGTNGNIVGTGTLTGLTGLTSSGTILFSGLSSGVVHSSSGTLSVSAVTNAELQNSSVTINTGTGLSGGGSVSLGGTLNLANTGVTALAGTLNQIAVSNGGVGSVTLSLPQDINTTSSPTFNGLTVSSFTRGSDTITDFTGTGLQVTGGALETTLGTSVDLASEVTGILPSIHGGTGADLSGAAQGAIPFFSSTAGVMTVLPPSTAGYVLQTNGSNQDPSWVSPATLGTNYWQRNLGSLSLLNITDDLLVGGASTGSARFRVNGTTGDIVGSGTLTGLTGLTSSGTILFSGLSSGVVHSSSGTLSVSAVTNAELQNSSVTINTGTGLSGGGSVSLGGTLNLANTGVTALAGTLNQIAVSNGGVGSVTLSLPQDINTTSSPTFNGLTVSSFTRGSDTITDFTGTGLQVTGGALETTLGTSVDLTTEVNGVLPVANGGTNTNSIGSAGSVAYSDGSKYAFSAVGTGGQVLVSGGTGAPTWVDSASLGTNYWQRIAGTVSPLNITDDLLLGGTSTGSAKFQIFGTSGNASTSGTLTFNTSGSIQTTNNQTLTIGGITTGNIVLSPNGGSGIVTANGTVNLSGGNAYQIGGVSVLNSTTLGTNVVNSSLTSVGALNVGSIANGFSTIFTSNTIQGSDITASGTTGFTGTGAGADLTFSGTGNHSITASSGTLQLDTATLIGDLNGGTKNVTNIANLGATGTITFGSLSTGLVKSDSSGVLSYGALNLAGGASYISGILPSANGGTGADLSGAAQGAIPFFTSTAGVMGALGPGTAGYVLSTNGAGQNPSWISTSSLGTNYFQLNNGAISPFSSSLDLLLGSNATASAKFAFINNIGAGTPTASVSAQNGTNDATYLTANGVLGTTNAQTLQLGSASTGNIALVSGGTSVLTGYATGALGLSSNYASCGMLTTVSSILTCSTVPVQANYVRLANGAFSFVNDTADFLFGSNATSSANFRLSASNTSPTASVAGSTSNAALSVDNTGTGDLLTVSKTGATKFVVKNNGDIAIAANQVLDTLAAGTIGIGTANATTLSLGRSGQGITLGGFNNCGMLTTVGTALTCGAAPGAAVNYWQMNNGAVSPFSNSLDLLLGATSTASAKFAFTGVNSGVPTASISANSGTGALYLTGAGNIGTTSNQSLTLGGATTGNIYLSPFGGSGTGNVFVGGLANCDTIDTDANGKLICGTDAGGSGSAGTINVQSNGSPVGTNVDTINFGTDFSTTASPATRANVSIASNILDYTKFADNLTLDASTNTSFAGFNYTFTGTGRVGIGTQTPLASLDARATLATIPAASFSGTTTSAAAIVDQSGSGDLFTASKSGATKFVITNAGNIQAANYNTAGGILYTDGAGNVFDSTQGGAGQLLMSNGAGAPTWVTSSAVGVMQRGAGVVAPVNITDDLLLGSLSTGSAKFAFTGVAGGTPTASISAQNGTNNAAFLTATGVLATTNKQQLTLGDANTGSIVLAGYNSCGMLTTVGTTLTCGSVPAAQANYVRLANGAFSFVNDTADFLFGSSASTSAKYKLSTSGTAPVASVAGSTSFAAEVIDQTSTGDLFTASKSGATKFTILNSGNIALANYNNCGMLTTNGTMLTCGTAPVAAQNYWQLNAGALSPFSSATDLLIGSISTGSAKFAFTGVSGGTPTASISASNGNNATFLSGAGNLGTTNAQTLTLGGTTTGNVVIDSGSGLISLLDTLTVGTNAFSVDTAGAITSSKVGSALTLSGAGATIDFTGAALARINSASNQNIALMPGGAGLVGIGTTSPTALLDVNGTASVSGAFTFRSGSPASIQSSSNQTLTLGGSSTGNIVLSPLGGSGAGNVFISGLAGCDTIDTDANGKLVCGTDAGGSSAGIINVQNNGTPVGVNVNTINFTTDFSVTGPAATATVAIANNILDYTKFADNLTLDASTNTSFAGFNYTFTGSGKFGIGTNNPLASLDARATTATLPAASFSGSTTNATVIVDQTGTGDLFTASKSGAAKFTILNSGNIAMANYNNCTMLTTVGTMLTCYTGVVGTNYFQLGNAGTTISQANTTQDLLLGGTSTAAAKFAFTGNAGGTPVASIAAQNGTNNAAYLSATGILATTNKQQLTLGDGNTGSIVLANYNNCTMLTTVGTTLTCSSVPTSAGNYFQLGNAGTTISQGNLTQDLLLGGTSTSAAKFAFTGNAGGTPVASISANNGNNAVFITGAGNLGTTNAQTLTLGGSTTGNIVLDSGGAGLISLQDATVIAGTLNQTGAGQVTFTGNVDATNGLDVTNANLTVGTTAFTVDNTGALTTTKVGSAITLSGAGAIIDFTGAGVARINSANNQNIALMPGTSGAVGINTTTPTAMLDVNGTASVSGSLTFRSGASAIQSTVNNTLTLGGNTTGDISFKPGNAQSLYLATNGQVTLSTSAYNNCGVLTTTNGLVNCASSGSVGTNFFQVNNGAVSPFSSTLDLLLGSTATATAKFAFINNTGAGTPTASISAQNGTNNAAYLSATGVLATTNKQQLTLGDGNTGSIVLANYSSCGMLTTVGTTLTCSSIPAGAQNYWQLNNGALSPFSSATDLLIGSTATTSAQFSVLGIAAGTNPTASVSATSGGNQGNGISLAGNGSIQSLRNNTLTLGGNTTGNIAISPNGGGAGSLLTVNALTTTFNGTNTLNASSLSTINGIAGTLTLAGTTTLAPTALTTITASNLATITSAASLGISATTLTLGNGSNALLSTVTNGDLTLQPAGNGNLILNGSAGSGETTLSTDFNSGVNVGAATNTPAVLSVSGGIGNNAALIVNNSNSGDLITASASGTTKFTVDGSGNIKLATGATIDTLAAAGTIGIGTTNATTLNLGGSGITSTTLGSSILANCAVLTTSSNTIGCGSAGSVGTNYWQVNNGAVSPFSSTLDLLVGGTSTASAKFAFINNTGAGTPTASISAQSGNNSALVLGADSTIQSVKNQTLTIGGNTTGAITIAPLSGGAGSILNLNTVTANFNGTTTMNATSMNTINGVSGTLTLNNVTGLTANAVTTLSATALTTITGPSNTLTLSNYTGLTASSLTTLTTNASLTLSGATSLSATGLATTNLGASAGTLNLGNGGNYTIATTTNGNLTITPAGSGQTILSSDADSGVNVGSAGNTPAVLSVSGGIGSNASFIVNNNNNGNLIAASASGITKFTVDGSGNIKLATGTTVDTLAGGTLGIGTTNATTLNLGGTGTSTVLGNSTLASCAVLTTSSGVIGCGSAGSVGTNYWQMNNGALSPFSSTLDLLVGSTATTSAQFSVLGIAAGTNPTASVSATTGGNNGNGISLAGNGTIQSLRNNSLTLGGNTTGAINISPTNGGAGSILNLNTVTANFNGTTTLNATSMNTINGVSGTLTLNNVTGLTANAVTTLSATALTTITGPSNTLTLSNYTGLTASSLTTLTTNASLTLSGATSLSATGLATTNLGASAGTLNLGNGGNYTIATTSNGNLTITPAGSGKTVLSTDADSGVNVGAVGNTPAVLSVSGGIGNNAALIVNNSNSGDLITASASGTTKFTVDGSGNIKLATGATLDTLAGSGTLGIGTTNATTLNLGGTGTSTVLGNSTLASCAVLTTSSGVIGCGSSGSVGTNYWQMNTGAVSPFSSTLDLLIGSTATTSAKFSVLGIAAGTNPTASVSATSGGNNGNGIVMAGDGSIQSLRNNSLTLGGNTTGSINISPTGGGAGSILNLNTVTANFNGTTTLNATSMSTINGVSGTLTLNNVTGLTANAVTTLSATALTTITGPSNTLTLSNYTGLTASSLTTLTTNASLTLSGATSLSATGLATTNLGASAGTLNLGNGGNYTIATTTNGTLTITPAGSGETVLSTDADSGVNVGAAANTPAVLSVSGGIGSNASFIVNNTNTGNLIAASASGTTKFTVDGSGNIKLATGATIDTLAAAGTIGIGTTNATTLNLGGSGITSTTLGSSILANCAVLTTSSNTIGCGSAGSVGTNFFQVNNGAVSPFSSTLDLLLGSTATATAKFAFINNAGSGTPTASISAQSGNNSALVLGGDGSIQSVKRQTLTLGGTTTGDISFSPGGAQALYLSGSGNITLNSQYNNCAMLSTTGTALTCNASLPASSYYVRLSQGAFSFGNDTADFLFGNVATSGAKFKLSSNGTAPVASVSAKTSYAALVVDNTGAGDLFAASTSGATKFVITNSGNVGIGTSTPSSPLQVMSALGDQFKISADATHTLTFDVGVADASITGYHGALYFGNYATANATRIYDNGSLQVLNVDGNPLLNADTTTAELNIGGLPTGIATLSVSGLSGTQYVGQMFGNTAEAVLAVNNTGSGDLFTASRSGTTKFTITNSGSIVMANYNNCGMLTTTGTTLTCSSAPTGTNFFQVNNGAVSPFSSTLDLLLGSTATATAKFAFINNTGAGTPTASISAQNGTNNAAYLSATGILATTNKQQLTLGDGNTGSIILANYNNCTMLTTVGTTLTCGAVPGSAQNYWQVNSGALSPFSSKADLLIGSTASSSASFAVLGIAAGTNPSASVSALTNGTGVSINGDGSIQSFRKNTLQVGGATTGDISFKPNNTQALYLNSTGNVTLGVAGQTFTINPNTITLNTAALINPSASGTIGLGTATTTNLTLGTSGANTLTLNPNAINLTSATALINPTGSATIGLGTATTTNLTLGTSGANTLTLNPNAINLTSATALINPTGSATIGLGTATTTNLTLGTSGANTLTLNPNAINLTSATALINPTGSATIGLGTATTTNLTLGTSGANTLTLNPNTINLTGFSGCGMLSTTGTALQCGTTQTFWRITPAGTFSFMNDTMDFLFGGNASTSAKFKLSSSGTSPTASVSGRTSYAALTVDQAGSGDLFTASKSGATKFVINNAGNIGIGTAMPTAPLEIAANAGVGGNYTVLGITGNLNAVTSPAKGVQSGIDMQSQINPGAASTLAYIGGYFEPTSSSNNLTGASIIALEGQPSFNGTGTLDSLVGGYFQNINYNTGTINNAYGIKIDSTLNLGGGVITNNYGLYVNAPTSGVNNYAAIFNGGYVGIGTTPGYPLDVSGGIRSDKYILGGDLSLLPVAAGQSAISSWWGLQLVGNRQNNVDYAVSNYGSAGDFSVIIPNQQASAIGLVLRGAAAQTANLMQWQNSSGTPLGSLSANGSISIGTTSPIGALDIRANSGTLAVATISGATADAILHVDQSGLGDIFAASRSGRMIFTIKNSGYVGIDTGNPTQKLDISSGDMVVRGVTNIANPGDRANLYLGDTSNGIAAINGRGISMFGFLTGDAFTLQNVTGNIGIGTGATNPLYKLDVRGTSATDPVASVSGTTSGTGFGVDNNGSGNLFTVSNNGATKFLVKNSGDIGIGANQLINPLGNGTFGIATINTSALTLGNSSGTTTINGSSLTLGTSGIANCTSLQTSSGVVSCGAGPGQSYWRIAPASGNGTFSFMNDTMDFLFGSNASISAKFKLSPSGTSPTASVSGTTSYAALVVNNAGLGDIFTASTAGKTRFTVKNSGIVIIGDSTNGITFDPGLGGSASNAPILYAGSARPFRTITLSPEYAGAVLTASGSANTSGTMTSDASSSATPSSFNYENYYQWTTTNAALQDYTVVVRAKLPADFSAWAPTAITFDAYTNQRDPSNVGNKIDLTAYKQSNGSIVVLDQSIRSSTDKNWRTMSYGSGNVQALSAGDTIIFFIKMSARNGNDVMAGDIVLNYLSKY